jgi:YihY family inner membrane protein
VIPALLARLRNARTFLRFFVRRLYSKWDDDSIYFCAAAIAFNVLVTVLPLGLLLVTLSGYAYQDNGDLREVMNSWLEDAGPLFPDDINQDLENTFFSGTRTSITGALGLLTLFWLVSRLFGTIRTAFDRIFDVPRGRNPFLGKLFDFMLALMVSISLFSALVMTTLASLVKESMAGEIAARWPVVGRFVGTDSAGLIGAVFILLTFFALFWAAPNRRVSLRQAGVATVLAAALSWIGTRLYLWSISSPDWGLVYGSLAAVMATFLWLYLICVLLLASAEVSQIIHEWVRMKRTLKIAPVETVWLETVAE